MKLNKQNTEIDITADTEFIDEIVQRMTIGGRLPWSVPKNYIPLILSDAIKWFYKKYEDAYEIKHFKILRSDIESSGLNRSVVLPSWIVGVTDMQEVNGPSITQNIYSRSPSLLLTNALKFNDFVNGSINAAGLRRDGGRIFADQSYAITDSLITLYEQSGWQSIFNKPINYSYNNNTNKLRIQGSFSRDLVIEAFEGIEPRYLYNDELFIKYVVGKCWIDLKKIVTSFGFQMPGAITVDYEQYASDGQQMVDEVKQEIEDIDAADEFIIV